MSTCLPLTPVSTERQPRSPTQSCIIPSLYHNSMNLWCAVLLSFVSDCLGWLKIPPGSFWSPITVALNSLHPSFNKLVAHIFPQLELARASPPWPRPSSSPWERADRDSVSRNLTASDPEARVFLGVHAPPPSHYEQQFEHWNPSLLNSTYKSYAN